MSSVTLAVVVHGKVFEDYAVRMLASAQEHFRPADDVQLIWLHGEDGTWPHQSACRHRILCDNAHLYRGDHLYLIDADMRFEAGVGPEILSDGIVVTTHPGHPDPGQADAPWEQNTASTAYVPSNRRLQYHPGAFVGAPRETMLELADAIAARYEIDAQGGYIARWYDESYLNASLAHRMRPKLVLPGDYCYWDYWGDSGGPGGNLTRKIVHLDKTTEEFAWRDAQVA